MIKITDLKPGDIVKIVDGTTETEGVVSNIDRDDDKVYVNNGIQEFWYPMEQIAPLPLTEERLIHTLGFEREEIDAEVKYKKGPFRVLVHDPGNYTNLEVWYREDRRHFDHQIYVHELQNHHLAMTKVPLEKAASH